MRCLAEQSELRETIEWWAPEGGAVETVNSIASALQSRRHGDRWWGLHNALDTKDNRLMSIVKNNVL